MIVCHCQHITDTQIADAVDWMRHADPQTIITPGKVYRALGKSADCGGCMPLFLATMRENANLEVPMQLRGLNQNRFGPDGRKKDFGSNGSRAQTQENRDEGRRESHRISERGSP